MKGTPSVGEAPPVGLPWPGGRRRRSRTAIAAALLLALVLATTAWRVKHDRDFVQSIYDLRLTNLANAVAEGAELTVRPLFASLEALTPAARLALEAGSPHSIARLVDTLRLLRESAPEGLEFFVLSPEGRIVAASSDEPPGPVDLSASESFGWHRENPGSQAHFSRPLEGVIGVGRGTTIIRLSHSWRAASGELGGVVVATFAPDRLRDFHTRLRLGKTGVITIFREDGTLLSRQPVAPGTIGRRYSDTPLFNDAANIGRTGLFDTRFSADGLDRRVAFRRLDRMPLIATVGLAKSEVLAPWYARSAVDLSLTGLLLSIALATGVYALRAARDSEARALATAQRFALLASGSAEIARSADIEQLVHRVTDLCRRLIPAHQALTSFTRGADFSQQIRAVALSDKYVQYRDYGVMPDGSGIYRLVCEQNRPFRLTQAELEAHPAWRGFGHAAADHPPLRGWLAAPLVGRDGANLGLIQLSDRETGEFDETDEAILVQLGLLAATALENFRLFEATHEAEQRYRSILEAAHEGVWLVDRDGRTQFVNARMAEILGCVPAQMIGADPANYALPAPGEPPDAPAPGWHLRFDEADAPLSVEAHFRHRDGRRIETLMSITSLKDQTGEVTGLLAMVSDLSARRAAEAEAIRARQEIETILGSISDGFFALDEAWRFRYVNAEGERMLRRSRHELLGRSIWEVFPEAERAEFGDRLRSARTTGQAARFDIRYRPHDICAEVRAFPHELGLSIYVLDTTQRVKAEQAAASHLRAMEDSVARYERLKANSLDVICTLDADGRFTEVSARARQTWGYEPAEMIGRPYESFVHPDDLERTRAATSRVLAGEPVADLENRYLCKDGRVARMLWNAVWSEADRAVFALARDITDRAELEERMRQSQRMEAIGQLTGGVAHDFNNLLTVILGNSAELASALADHPGLLPLAEMSRTAAERAAELTSRLLAFARRQPLNPRPINLNRRLADLEGLLGRLIGEQIDIALAPAPGLWLASVDAAQFDVAIINLAVNARDAMPGGGKLTIETSNADLDDAYAAANRDVVPGRYVCVAISDNGSGMTPDVLARAFDPFFTTKPVSQGSGLGLSMVYGFARQSGGNVKICSEPGQGTTVRLHLPYATAEDSPAPEASDGPVLRGAGAICLVEDDPMVRDFTRTILVDLGYEVSAYGNADDALAAIDAGLQLDLLLTDIVLPGSLNGRQLADEARIRRPGLKVLFVSGYSQNAIIHHGRLDPGVELLSKPFRRADLARRLHDLLG